MRPGLVQCNARISSNGDIGERGDVELAPALPLSLRAQPRQEHFYGGPFAKDESVADRDTTLDASPRTAPDPDRGSGHLNRCWTEHTLLCACAPCGLPEPSNLIDVQAQGFCPLPKTRTHYVVVIRSMAQADTEDAPP